MENKISFLGDEMCSPHWCCVYVSWAFNWKFVGKTNMGSFWVWDARGTSMLILLFLYVGVYSLGRSFHNANSGEKASAFLAIVGTVNIPIIYKSVDWWFTLHQPATH